MHLDGDRCYAATLARDARFDGRFFIGVKTTGIYCRPICPAQTPKRQNVRFFAHAAAAEEAGHRPCKRCRPDAAPGSPAWIGAPATVARALRLIEGGDDIDTVAGRVGVSVRQLHRLFTAHVGAPPGAVLRARRAHFARRMLDETDLPVTHIAFTAGFGSVRQFNAVMLQTFRMTPTEMRARRRRHPRPSTGLDLRLSYRPPFDWADFLAHLPERTLPGIEVVEGGVFRRLIAAPDGAPALIEVSAGDGHLQLKIDRPIPAGLVDVVARVRRMFDLDADPTAAAEHLGQDPSLRPLLEQRPGLRVAGAWDPFELSVRAILGQQISVAGATTLAGRIVRAFGKPVEGYDALGLTHLFPTPEVLAIADLSGLGITGARIASIQALSQAVLDGEIVLDGGTGLDDLVERLCRLRGIGSWTAHYIAMRGTSEPDAFPAADLALVKVTGLTPRELTARAEAWRPWRAYAAFHLWRSL